MRAGWEIRTIGEVCEIRSGRNQKEVENPTGKYPIYGSGGVMGYADDYLCEAGATIIGRKGSSNNPIFVNTRFWNVDTAFGFSPKETILPKFLFYFCKGFNFQAMNKGTTIPSLVKTDLLQIHIPVPSLPEQQRIVDILDQEFAKIDVLKANAEKSLQAAKDLFQATLKKELEPRSNMMNATLGDIISFERGLTYSKGDEVAYSSVGVLRSNNVDLTTQSLILDEIKYLREDFEVPSKKKVKKSSLLMCMSNGSKDHLGKVALIDSDLDYAFGGFMGLLTPNEAKVFPKYLYYALSSKFFKDYIHSLADGANINNLKYKDLSIFRVALPSLVEQEMSVSRLDELNGRCKSLQENYQKTLTLCDDLKQSLLRKAFNGEL